MPRGSNPNSLANLIPIPKGTNIPISGKSTTGKRDSKKKQRPALSTLLRYAKRNPWAKAVRHFKEKGYEVDFRDMLDLVTMKIYDAALFDDTADSATFLIEMLEGVPRSRKRLKSGSFARNLAKQEVGFLVELIDDHG